jgi:hypothetical protein
VGTLTDFHSAADVRAQRSVAQPHDRIRLSLADGHSVEAGDQLLTYRWGRAMEGVGMLVIPTGIVTVDHVEGQGAIVDVSMTYDRLELGNQVVPLEPFELESGVHPSPVSGDLEATIVTFDEVRELQKPGDVAILDVGTADDVAIGDEFIILAGEREGWRGDLAGRLKVVRVSESSVSARIIEVSSPVFVVGARVFLSRKMP